MSLPHNVLLDFFLREQTVSVIFNNSTVLSLRLSLIVNIKKHCMYIVVVVFYFQILPALLLFLFLPEYTKYDLL